MITPALLYTYISKPFYNWQYIILSYFTGFWLIFNFFYTNQYDRNRKYDRLEQAIPISNGLIKKKWYEFIELTLVFYKLVITCFTILALFKIYELDKPLESFIQVIWKFFIDKYNHKQLFIYGIFLVHALPFWVGSIFNFLLDKFHPICLKIYKIQHEETIPMSKWIKGLILVIMNEFIAYNLVHVTFYIYSQTNIDGFSENLPSIIEILSHMFTFSVISEIWFYFSHRIMHKSDFLWNNVHKVHHEITAPSIFFSLYTHPVEYVFGNFPTLALGPIILGSHFIIWILWTFISTVDFCSGHCGWHLPFTLSAEFHDYHHRMQTGNYGTGLKLFDEKFRTDVDFDKNFKDLDKIYTTPDYSVDKVLKKVC